jgi:hypothetical protein
MDSSSSFQSIPDVPVEPSTPPPRGVCPSADTRILLNVLTVLTALTLIAGCWFFANAIEQARQSSVLRRNGTETMGEISSLQRFGRSGHIVRYTFTANGVTVSGEAKVPSASMENLQEFNVLRVRFLPSNPSVNQPLACEPSLSKIWTMTVIPMPFLGILGTLFLVLHRRRHLLSAGSLAFGIVTNCTFNGRSFSVKYQFVTDTKLPVKGRGWSPDQQRVGQRIWVLYLLQNPRRNRPYPFPDYKLEQ